MNSLVEKFSKAANVSEIEVERLIESITTALTYEGCPESDPRFFSYLTRRLRKRLKIEDSSALKTFKQFFKEK